MFDANLCEIPVGSSIYVRFHGKIGGDKSNIQAGTYACKIVKSSGARYDRKGIEFLVLNPSLRKNRMPKSLIVTNLDVGCRWVTFEGYMGESND